jgi:uncharacterized protein (TIGR02145 family)
MTILRTSDRKPLRTAGRSLLLAPDGQITVSKVVTDEAEDNTTFSVTVTGQRAINPRIVEKEVSQDTPAVFTRLPYDTYVITEEAQEGYSITSIVPDEVTLSRSNKTEEVVVTNAVEGLTPIKYGLLYNWYAATDARCIAPTGWHVPALSEIGTLATTISSNGGALKETGFTYWDSPNTLATNELGFNFRGSGQRLSLDGTFGSINLSGWIVAADLNTGRTQGFVCSYNDEWFVYSVYSEVSGGLGTAIRCLSDSPESWTEGDTVTDYDGNIYPTVKIGDQVWIAANLIVKHYNNGDDIPNVTDNGDWAALTDGAWCYYDNDPDNM